MSEFCEDLRFIDFRRSFGGIILQLIAYLPDLIILNCTYIFLHRAFMDSNKAKVSDIFERNCHRNLAVDFASLSKWMLVQKNGC